MTLTRVLQPILEVGRLEQIGRCSVADLILGEGERKELELKKSEPTRAPEARHTLARAVRPGKVEVKPRASEVRHAPKKSGQI